MYIDQYDLDDCAHIAEVNHLKALLHDMVAVDVLDEIQTQRLNQFDDFALQVLSLGSVFDCLLHYSAPIAVLRKLQNVLLNDLKQSPSVLSLAPLKYLLEHIVSKLVFSQLNALSQQGIKDCTFRVPFSALDD